MQAHTQALSWIQAARQTAESFCCPALHHRLTAECSPVFTTIGWGQQHPSPELRAQWGTSLCWLLPRPPPCLCVTLSQCINATPFWLLGQRSLFLGYSHLLWLLLAWVCPKGAFRVHFLHPGCPEPAAALVGGLFHRSCWSFSLTTASSIYKAHTVMPQMTHLPILNP